MNSVLFCGLVVYNYFKGSFFPILAKRRKGKRKKRKKEKRRRKNKKKQKEGWTNSSAD